MYKSVLCTAGLAVWLVLCPSVSRATLVDQGGATLDTLTGLLWLDASATEGLDVFDADAALNDPLLQAQLADGWRLATLAEVCDLFASYSGDTSGLPCPNTGVVPDILPFPELVDSQILDLIFDHVDLVPGTTAIHALFDDGQIGFDTGGAVLTYDNGFTGTGIRFDVFEQSRSKLSKFLGVTTHSNALLVKVPEPAPVLLLGAALLALLQRRRAAP